MRARTVEDIWLEDDGNIEVKGTKVGDDVLSTDKDTVFPLQGALGYELTQSLFVGPNTLLVEGLPRSGTFRCFPKRCVQRDAYTATNAGPSVQWEVPRR